ncbi:MAG: T9SS type A sorting domain-containing protein [Saprospiraceae bacterium]
MKTLMKFFVILFCYFQCIPLSANIIYVNTNVPGGLNDGSSWENAYTLFQPAINEAIYGDSIWIAQGTYMPTNGSIREFTFVLRNGVKWFGGFQGGEVNVSERDVENYPTILSGDIGVQGDSTDNSYHVVYTIGTDSNTLLDGFFIKYGQADDGPINSDKSLGGGLLIKTDNGDNLNASPKIRNCTFSNNFAIQGGGVNCTAFFPSNIIEASFVNCQFIGNNSSFKGGGISKGGSYFNLSQPFIQDCYFEKNESKQGGAAIFQNVSGIHQVLDTEFQSNYAPNGFGGGIFIDASITEEESNFKLIGCHFEDSGSVLGSAISFYRSFFFPSLFESQINIEACDFISNNELVNNSFVGNETVATVIYLGNYSSSQVELNILESNFLQNNIDTLGILIDIGIDDFQGEGAVKVLIDKCLFEGNGKPFINPFSGTEVYSEGIIYSLAEILISNSIFRENDQRLFQPYASNLLIDDEFNLSVVNCLFYKNGKRLATGKNLDFFNCTFFENGEDLIEGDSVRIRNSIFWENQDLDKIFVPKDSSLQGYDIKNTLLKNSDCIFNGIDWCGDEVLFNIYPEFRDTANLDFSLRSCSPALNLGDDLTIDTLEVYFDIEGNPRSLDDAVDLGAFETQAFEIFTPQVQDVTCNGLMDGEITWGQHGTPDFIFEWNNGVEIGTNFSVLSSGNYDVSVTDADNCSGFFSVTINEPQPIQINDVITNATSSMNADGVIELNITGGNPGYTFIWSNGSMNNPVENLLPGIYSVTVTDNLNCFDIQEFEVGISTGLEENEHENLIQLYPNVIQKGTSSFLRFELNKTKDLEINLFNELGQLLFSDKINRGEGQSIFQLPMMNHSGIFFINIKDKMGRQKILKWIIN